MASIEERDTGSRVIWRLNRPGHPRHQKKQHLECDSLSQAEEARDIAKAHRHRLTRDEVEALLLGEDPNAEPESTAPLFQPFCERYLSSLTRPGPGTMRRYRRQLESRIYPVLGHLHVDLITVTDIGLLINALRADGLGNNTLTRYYSVVHGAFEAAVAEKLREDNPARRSDFVRDQVADDDDGTEHRVYLTPEDYEILLAAFAEEDRPFAEAAFGTGGRWAELTALQPRDLVAPTRRQSRARLWIRRAWKQDAKNRWYIGTTKGRLKRCIEIDDDLHLMLCLLAVGKADDALLLTAPEGGRLVHSNFVNRVWHPAVVRASRCAIHPPPDQDSLIDGATGVCGDHGGRRSNNKPCGARLLPGLDRCRDHRGPARDAVSECDCSDVLHSRPTPHSARHTHASWLFANPEVSTHSISRRMGHASLNTTDQIYGGLAPSAEHAAVDAIAAVTRRRQLSVPVTKPTVQAQPGVSEDPAAAA